MEIVEVPTWENIADSPTKFVNKEAIGKHMKGSGSRHEQGRHELMPEFDVASEVEGGCFHKGGEEGREEKDEQECEGDEVPNWNCPTEKGKHIVTKAAMKERKSFCYAWRWASAPVLRLAMSSASLVKSLAPMLLEKLPCKQRCPGVGNPGGVY